MANRNLGPLDSITQISLRGKVQAGLVLDLKRPHG